MAALKINVSQDLHSRLKARAKDNGFSKLEDYVKAMLIADVAGPEMNDDEIEALLLSRIDGPFVPMDASDFQRIRQELKEWRDNGRPESGL